MEQTEQSGRGRPVGGGGRSWRESLVGSLLAEVKSCIFLLALKET